MRETGFVREFDPATGTGYIGFNGKLFFFRSADVVAGDPVIGATAEFTIVKDYAPVHGAAHLQQRGEVARDIRVVN